MSEERSLYSQANTLCNNLDKEIMKLTKECIGSPCVIKDGKDIFTKMYNINKAFEYVAKARSLLMNAKG